MKKIDGVTSNRRHRYHNIHNLCYEIAGYILPRLRQFKESTDGFPHTLTETIWYIYLDEMIWGFQYVVDIDKIEDELLDLWYDGHITSREYLEIEEEAMDRLDLSLELFSRFYLNLAY